jgi:hypothetical protein
VASPISALEHEPHDFIREVSPEAISFYVDEISGIYLPDEFMQQHAEVFDVRFWKPDDRLRGKFGRFALSHAQEEEEQVALDDILVMGTTIGLSGLDRDGDMGSLRHFSLQNKVRDVLEARDLVGKRIRVDRADYGDTTIVLAEDGSADSLRVGGSSIDFGRAKAEGRQQTCNVFEQLLGNAIKVINEDPEPKDYERIVE